MLSIGLVLSASVMMCLARPRPVRPRFGVISGVLVAAGVSTKLTFAPASLAVWGVLIGPPPRAGVSDGDGPPSGARRRLALIHLAAMALAMLILLAPILGQFGAMVAWFKNIAVHDGYYGRSSGHLIVNPSQYPRQLWALILAEPVVAGVALGGVLLAGALFIPRLARRLDDQGRRARAVLVAVAAAQVIQFVLVAKHMAPRYLVPAVALSGPAVCLAFVLTRGVLQRPPVRWTVLSVAIVGLAYGTVSTFRSAGEYLVGRRVLSAQQVALARRAEPLESKSDQPGSGAVLVYTSRSSSPANALFFGNIWAGLRFSDDLIRMFPDRVLYVVYRNRYTDAAGVVVPREKLEAWAAEGRLHFQVKAEELPEEFLYDTVVPSHGASGGLFRARLPKQVAMRRDGGP